MIEPSAPDPDVARAAEDAFPKGEGESPSPSPPKRGPGAPKGTRPWNKGKGSGGAPKAKAKPEPRPAVDPTEDEVLAVTVMVGLTWKVLGPRVGLDPLLPEEEQGLGQATAAVLKKYLPGYGEWEPEINLALCLAVLFAAKYRGKPVRPTDETPDLELPGPAPSPAPRSGPYNPADDPFMKGRAGGG